MTRVIDPGPAVRRLLPPTLWQRRTLWIWNAANSEQTTRQWLAQNAVRLGFRVVCIKVHDGDRVYDKTVDPAAQDNGDPSYYRTLKAAGLIVGGWGYLRGDGIDTRDTGGVEREAARAVERCRTLNLDFYVSDPEAEYAKSGAQGADRPAPGDGFKRLAYSARFVEAFAREIRTWRAPQLPRFPRGVASYGRGLLHDVDMSAWLHGSRLDGVVWRNCMQAYRNMSQALDVALCVSDAERIGWDRRFVHPLLGVYRGVLGTISVAEYEAELQRAGTVGFGLYLLDEVDLAQLPGFGQSKAAR